jgi:hypothetical protein
MAKRTTPSETRATLESLRVALECIERQLDKVYSVASVSEHFCEEASTEATMFVVVQDLASDTQAMRLAQDLVRSLTAGLEQKESAG